MKELKVFDQLTSDIATLVGPVSKLKVVDFKTSETAVKHGSAIQGLLKEIEERRDSLVRPRNEEVKKVNEYAREIKAPLEAAKRHLEAEVGAFAAETRRQKAIEEARIEAERVAKEEQIAAKAQAALDALEAERAEAAAELDPLFGDREEHEAEFARQQEIIQAEAEAAHGRARAAAAVQKYDASRQDVKGARMVWEVELVDINQVPVEFLIREINRSMILAAARGGNVNIPGVRVFQKPSVGFGQNTYVPQEAIMAERARPKIAATAEPHRHGRRATTADVQPTRRAAGRATSGRRS